MPLPLLPLLLVMLSTGVGGGSSAGGSGADPAIGTISLEVDPGVDVLPKANMPTFATFACAATTKSFTFDW